MANPTQNQEANKNGRNPLLQTVNKPGADKGPQKEEAEGSRFSPDSPDDNEFEDDLANSDKEISDSGKPIP